MLGFEDLNLWVCEEYSLIKDFRFNESMISSYPEFQDPKLSMLLVLLISLSDPAVGRLALGPGGGGGSSDGGVQPFLEM